MIQQINLYQRALLEKRIPFSAKTLAATLLLLVSALAGVGAVGEWHLSRMGADLARLQGETRVLEAGMGDLQAALSRPPSPLLEQEVARLRADRDQRQAVLARIEKRPAAAAGFSPLLSALASQTIPGLWLRRIAVSGGGEHLSLEGCAGRPELVPRLVQQLASEPVFAGLEFARLQLEREKDGRVIDFVLSTEGGESR